MQPHILRFRSRMPVTAQKAFEWHQLPDAFERLAPPWQRLEIVERQGTIRAGDGIRLKVWFGPFPLYWSLVHREFIDGQLFTDEQVSGPFKQWIHRHRFHDEGGSSCVLEDEIEYLLPFDRLTYPLVGGLVKRELSRLFRYRHRRTRDELLVP